MTRAMKAGPAKSRTKLPILITESAEEFLAVRSNFYGQFKPTDVIEGIYVDEIVTLVWELQRERNGKANLINAAYRPGLSELLKRLLNEDESLGVFADSEADELAAGWFDGDAGKEKVLKILNRFNLDETAIEAQARMQVSDLIMMIDRSIAIKSARLDKAIRFIHDYRSGLGRPRIRQLGNNMMQSERPVLIDHNAKDTTSN